MKILYSYGRLIVVAWLTAHLLFSCAKQGTLTGGPKDITPPKLMIEKSDTNYLTNHYPSLITLYFDEWIQLKNQSQILVSPPLEYNPKISSKGKRVEVEIDERETLRDSTTYSINFASSIVDFAESNPVSDFIYVFATGDIIDSLILSGQVIDAYTKKPVEKVSVMLYDEDRDSIVFEEKPYYFGTTDKSGNFTIRNMRAGRFKCFALLDGDYNFLFNQETEKIGFIDTLIDIQAPDSLKWENKIEMEIFQQEAPQRITEQSITHRGKLKLIASKKIEHFSLDTFNFKLFEMESIDDSVMIWYEPDTLGQDSLHLVYSLAESNDTIIIKSKSSTKSIGPVLHSSNKERNKILLPEEKLFIKLNQPIQSIDTSFIRVLLPPPRQNTDSLENNADTIAKEIAFTVLLDSVDHRSLYVLANWNNEKKYELKLFPGALNNYFKNTNDTLSTAVSFESQENLGNIICRFDSLNKEKQYVVVLKQKQSIIQQDIMMDVLSKEIRYNNLKPGKYMLEIIEDENKNGRWDPGNYLLKKQSEKVLEVNLEELRKNWDLETEIKWDSQ